MYSDPTNKKTYYYRMIRKKFKSRNNTVLENSAENIESKPGIGEYTHYKFNKLIKKVVIKKELDKYIETYFPNKYLPDEIFNEAFQVLVADYNNNHITNYNLYQFGGEKLYKGVNENNIYNSVNVINNDIHKKEPNKRCDDIENKYRILSNKKDEEMNNVYKKRIKREHLNTESYINFNNDYDFYLNPKNNCF